MSLLSDHNINMSTKLTITKRQSYTVSDKLRIIQFAEQNGNRAAEREFGVSESNVRLWRKSKENLEKMPRLKRANRGKKAAWPELEIDLLAWITEKRNNGLAILPSIVRLKALDLAKDEKYNIPEGHFKAGNHWCQRFMKRNNLSLRQKTTLAQRLPDDYEEKIVRFHRFIIDRRKENSYPLHFIANMDETPLTFDMPPNRTINSTGEKTVKIRTTGNEKNRVTVVLACCGDGSKLKPMVIFKRKTVPKINNKHGVVVSAQEKGWMDTEQMKVWIDKVWRWQFGGLRKSLLVYDAFEAHVTDRVKALFKRERTDLAVIPGGLTSILQPLDVSLNKPFKDGVRRQWMQWMAEGIHELTATGRQKKASEELICSWISQAWNDIPAEMITSSFLKCGITNNLDGSEDDLVYNSAADTDELDDSFVRELFASDSESDFEGFVV